MAKPKSSRQRRSELTAKRQRRAEETRRAQDAAEKQRAEKLEAERILRPNAVDMSELAPDNSYDAPDFILRGYYVDLPFKCKRCGKEQVWTAAQQKWWYEVAKGNRWTTAKFCRPCRQRERNRRDEARRVHLDGIAEKEHRNRDA